MQSRFLNIFLALAVAIIICWLLQLLKFVFLPLIIAVFISFLLNPLIIRLTRYKIPHILAVFIALGLTILVLYMAGTIVLQSLVSFRDEFPRYEAQINEMIAQAENLAKLDIGPLDNQRLRRELSRLSLSSAAAYLLNSLVTFLTYLLFTLVFAIFLLLGRPKMPKKIRRAFNFEQSAAIIEAIDGISQQVQRYIWAKTLTSIITGGMMILVCLLFGIDFAVTFGFFTFLLNFVPTIGVLVASIPPPLVAVVQTGSWMTALWVILALIFVMMTLGNFIEPRILGGSVNLSPLVALFSLIFWGWLWGPAGMIVAVPVTAMIKFTCDHVDGLRPIGVLMSREV